MAGVAVVTTILSTFLSYHAQQEAADAAADAAEDAAQHAKESAALAERQLAEKHALDISLAKEQIEFEQEIYAESTQYTLEQIAKRDAEVHAAAIAGYAASGIDPYEEDSSALSVLTRIEEESLSEQERVAKGFETFTESRELELTQLKKSSSRTFEWFMEQSKFELDYELDSRYAEASMYRKQADYATFGSYFGSLSSGMSTYYNYKLLVD